ncbi:hypothetical protein GCM10028798_07250 [Humibacter antri]
MSERLHAKISVGAPLPGFAPRLAIALVGGVAALLLVPAPFGYLGLAFAILGALFPATLAAWGCALVIALTQLARTPEPGDWHPYATLAVIHLLHVIGSLSIVVEPGGVLQGRVLRGPLLGWLALQVPAQGVLVAVLLLASAQPIPLPLPGVFAAVGAVCIGALVVLIIRRR